MERPRILWPAAIATLITLSTSFLITLRAMAQQDGFPSSRKIDGPPPHPGVSIDADNVSSYSNYLPAAVAEAVRRGFKIQVIPSQRLDWSGSFKDATEKYSGQVALDKDDILVEYVAGMPFPIVSTSDPKAAIKIAYN